MNILANNLENEEKLAQVINNMYREEILGKDFVTIEEYMRAWGDFQDAFINNNDSYMKYEVWANFSKEKIKDG